MELRKTLDYNFKTNTDTETLVEEIIEICREKKMN